MYTKVNYLIKLDEIRLLFQIIRKWLMHKNELRQASIQ